MPQRSWSLLPGHIIRTRVPRTDSDESDERYPVVVSSKEYNEQFPDVIVTFTTRSSNIRHPQSYDVEISDNHPQFNLAGLPLSTTVRCGRLHTIKQSKIYDVIGSVPGDLLNDIQRLVLQCFPVVGSSDLTQETPP